MRSPAGGNRPGKLPPPAHAAAAPAESQEPLLDPDSAEAIEAELIEEGEADAEAVETVEAVEVMETEVLPAAGQESADEVPGSEAPRERRSTGSRARRGTGQARRTPSPRGSGSSQAPRQPGAEIGRMHRRGMSLAVKFSLFISILIILISSLFGLVVISLFREKLRGEIVRTGYDTALTLRAFGKRAYDRWKEWEDGTKRSAAPGATEYSQTETYHQDSRLLKSIVENDPRIYDVAFLVATPYPNENPSQKLLYVRNPEALTSPTNAVLEVVDLGGQDPDPDVKAYWGDYKTEKGTVNSLFVRVPIEKSAGKFFATATLVLSAEQIDREVRRLITHIGLFGLVFVGAGIALSLGLASAVSSPIHVLVRDMDIVSRGDLDHETRPQTNDEIGLLAMAFNKMTKSLQEARGKEVETERINSELNLAKEIHAKLMPDKIPNIPGYDIYTSYHCAKEVGGDYYDFFGVDQEHLGMVIADVSGKGIPGSITMAFARTILRMMCTQNLSPADVLAKTNYHVARDIKRGMFVTAMYVILNVKTREMVVASAGHNPMIIWRAASRSHELVRPSGIALGFDKGPIFDRSIREQTIRLHRGDRVVLFTDGVVEAMNENREEFSDERLIEFVHQHAELKSKEFLRLLLKELEEHKGAAEQHDDITLTTLRIE